MAEQKSHPRLPWQKDAVSSVERTSLPWQKKNGVVARIQPPVWDQWKEGLEGSDLERAILFAVLTGDKSHLDRILSDRIDVITISERRVLADYIMGRLTKRVGRRPSSLLLPKERNRRTVAQIAAEAVRLDMRKARTEGARVRDTLDQIVSRRAAEYGADPEKVRNAYRRGKAQNSG